MSRVGLQFGSALPSRIQAVKKYQTLYKDFLEYIIHIELYKIHVWTPLPKLLAWDRAR